MPNTSPSPPPSSRPLMSFEATLPPMITLLPHASFSRLATVNMGHHANSYTLQPALSPNAPKHIALIDIPNNVSAIQNLDTVNLLTPAPTPILLHPLPSPAQPTLHVIIFLLSFRPLNH